MDRTGITETEFYGVPDIATFLGVSMKTILRAIQNGELLATKFGRQWRIHKDDLKRYAGRLPGNTPAFQPSVAPPKPTVNPTAKPSTAPGGNIKLLLGPDGKPVLGPNNSVLDVEGWPITGPDGFALRAVLGPDGKALLGPDGTVVFEELF